MKNIKKYTMLIAAVLFGFQIGQAQCPNNNVQYGSSAAPSSIGQTVVLSYCLYGGEYRYVYNMQAGSLYAFETCGDSDFDTQITVYDAVTGAYIAYNDDYCGLQSRVQFISNGNPVRVLIDRYYCGSQSSCMTLRVTRLSGPSAVNPCNSISSLSCTGSASYSLSGSGAWNSLGGPWSTPGSEKVFSFTPTLSGVHSIAITHSGGYYVDLYAKAGSCSAYGWTYIDDIYTAGLNSLNLTAGVTYHFLIDDENTSSSSGTISITCPTPAANPCNNITSITSCGNTSSFNLSGSGAWNPPGPWGTPGEEAVFSYTPTVSGAHPITVTNSGYYVDLFYKTGSCGSSGWTYVSDIYTNETNTVNLTAGITYYFLIDDENVSPSSGTITVGCPCIPPPGGIDASLLVNGNISFSSTTVGACDDCSLRPTNDRVIELEITCKGTYTIATCGGASWDTYLYLTTAPCGGSTITSNDDNCGLQSSMTANLNPGTYYVAVEAWSSFWNNEGAFTLSITKSCDLMIDLEIDEKQCGYNISCYDGNDGSIEVTDNGCGSTYDWSNGSSSSSATNLEAGSYSVIVTDDYGCTASASATLTQPDPLEVDAGADEIVFYGYSPMSCADLAGLASGGCAGYDFNWSDGSSNVGSGSSYTACPSITTEYTLNVTDQNGCEANDQVIVCAVDVICYAGNSGNQKVEMCQIPPGNPSNAHVICVAPSAVPAHLAIGCTLGACGEIDATCNGISAYKPNSNTEKSTIEFSFIKDQVILFPNPAINEINIEFSTQIDETFIVEFYDILGKKLAQLPIGNYLGSDRIIHNVSSIESGNYFYKITIGNSQITKSVHIE